MSKNKSKILLDSVRKIKKIQLHEVVKLKANDEIKQLSAELILGLLKEMGLKEGKLSAQIKANIMATDKLIHHINALDILLIMKNFKVDVYEFFKGAHFKTLDNGELYEALRDIPGVEARVSSHFRGEKKEELGIHCGYIIPEILVLTVKKEDKRASHFQMEASAWRGVAGVWKHPYTLKHISDTVWYFMLNLYAKLLTGKPINLGAYGYSEHVDSNPVEVQLKKGTLNNYKDNLLLDLEKLASQYLEDTEHPPQDRVLTFKTLPHSENALAKKNHELPRNTTKPPKPKEN